MIVTALDQPALPMVLPRIDIKARDHLYALQRIARPATRITGFCQLIEANLVTGQQQAHLGLDAHGFVARIKQTPDCPQALFF
jgi:hypothetical protein